MMKWVRYPLEALFTLLIYTIIKLMPVRFASAMGGAIARAIGPLSKVHRVADYNMKRALPHLSESERQRHLIRMWDNLGRVFCEYPHLSNRTMKRAIEQVDGMEECQKLMDQSRPFMIISGHLGNWELAPVIAADLGMKLHLLYRPANNRIVDWLVACLRRPYTRGLYAKGMQSARGLLMAIRKREPVAMLVDQKTNNGIAVPFFGEEAMTTDAVAHFVLKYQVAVVPSRCIRLESMRFRMQAEPPMQFHLSGDEAIDTLHIMTQVNAKLEAWIKEDPGQWFWVHKRWPYSKAFAKGTIA